MENKRSKKNEKKIQNKIEKLVISLIVVVVIAVLEHFMGCITKFVDKILGNEEPEIISYNIGEIPEYKDSPYAVINDNKPSFEEKDYYREFEEYSELDSLRKMWSSLCKYY